MRVKAPAKINLTLEVLRRRSDGFHEVRMLMAGVDLCDQLEFKLRKDDRLRLTCSDRRLETGKGNLVLRAAERLKAATGSGLGADIHLVKKIPLAAGLAGGSSNAALTLLALNRLWKLRLSQNKLLGLAASIGSDVPYCLQSGWALAQGRGEKVKRLDISKKYWVVLANPGFEVSTKWAYAHVQFRKGRGVNYSKKVISAVKDKKIENIRKYCMNDLESATLQRYPKIKDLIQTLLENGAITSQMSGSGPTVWGLYGSAGGAEKALKIIKKKAPFAASAALLSKRPKF